MKNAFQRNEYAIRNRISLETTNQDIVHIAAENPSAAQYPINFTIVNLFLGVAKYRNELFFRSFRRFDFPKRLEARH
jgi:hypothetical protein